jgi:hypothetical protein
MTVPNTTYRVLVEKLGATQTSEFIGNEGEVFYNPDAPELKLSDGSTPGGLSIGGGPGGGGESYWVSGVSGISTDSNVGIGTTNPTEKLTVVGDARITGILTVGTASITLDGQNNTINIGSNVNIDGNTGIITATTFFGDGSGLTGVTTVGSGLEVRDNGNPIGVAATIDIGSNLSVSLSSGIATITSSGGSSSQWVTNNAGIHTLSNVGVGTTSPTSRLTVDGNVLVSGVVTATSFIGNLTGTATTATTATNAQGLIGTPNITVGVVTATSFVGNGSGLTGLPSGGSSSQWVTNNAGIHTLSNVGIGTTNPQVKLQIQGTLGFGSRNNIRIGDSTTGCSITSGTNNFFAGVGAGRSNTTGSFNNFFGCYAGCSNTTGNNNNFFGQFAGRYNTTGGLNNFIGRSAGYFNTTGFDNNFFGLSAGSYNTTGYYNNFFGNSAGFYNTTGTSNNFFGIYAGRSNTTGSCNNFVGRYVGRCNTTGCNNNFFGNRAGHSNTTGSFNNFFGCYAGCSNTTGSNNIALGCNSGNDAVYNFGTSPASNIIVLGNNSHTAAYIKVAWTVTSDERDKTGIAPVPHGLDFIQKLNPVQFQFHDRESGDLQDGRVRYGFLAQDIQKLEKDPKVIVDDVDPDNLKITESALIPVLVNAIQELNQKVQELSDEIQILKGL